MESSSARKYVTHRLNDLETKYSGYSDTPKVISVKPNISAKNPISQRMIEFQNKIDNCNNTKKYRRNKVIDRSCKHKIPEWERQIQMLSEETIERPSNIGRGPIASWTP
jgi:hypothetical protein